MVRSDPMGQMNFVFYWESHLFSLFYELRKRGESIYMDGRSHICNQSGLSWHNEMLKNGPNISDKTLLDLGCGRKTPGKS